MLDNLAEGCYTYDIASRRMSEGAPPMSESSVWLRRFVDDNDSNDIAAKAAIEDLGRLNERARELLHPILAEAILIVRRNTARAVEHRIPIQKVLAGSVTMEERKERLGSGFSVPGGQWVTWGAATIENRHVYIDSLDKKIAGLERTIAAHQAAIDRCEAAGVTCLDEIDEFAEIEGSAA